MNKSPAHFKDQFIHTKKLIKYEGKDHRQLTDDLTAYYKGWLIKVKSGYITDGASIPRAAWRLVGHPFEEYEAAAIIHDILYDTEHVGREIADDCFKELMKYCGIGKIRRNLIFAAVRCCGGFTWRKHTEVSKTKARQFLSVVHE